MSDEQVLAGYRVIEAFRAEGPVRSYRAAAPDGAEVCVKVVDADTEATRVAADSLERARSLANPNLALIREHGLTDSGYYLVREWVEGTHLATHPLPPRLAPQDAAAAVARGLAGMSALHAAGLASGDVRPSNFVVAVDGSVKLVDYCLPAGRPGQAGEPAATAYYTSPEEIAGDSPSQSSDLYRAGLVLYEVLAGRHPFDGTDAAAVVAGHERALPTAPSASDPRSPKALDAVVAKALEKNPAARYPSAEALAQAIEQAVAPKRSPWLWIAIAAVVLLLLAGAYALTRKPAPSPTAPPAVSAAVVPQLVGKAQSSAEASITGAGLLVGTISTVETLAVAAGHVVTQAPAAGKSVAPSSSVDFAVAAVPTVNVPDVIGKSQADAEAALKSAGFVPTVSKLTTDKSPAGQVVDQLPAAGTALQTGAQVAISVAQAPAPSAPTTAKVPNVVGMSQANAQSAIAEVGLVPSFVTEPNTAPRGTAIAQEPGSGTSVALGSVVIVELSSGTPPPPSTVAVPNVVGMTKSAAQSAISNAKLSSQISDEFSASVPKGTVAEQAPKGGSQVAPGTTVAIVVSLGPKPTTPTQVTVPDVKGKTAEAATQALADLKLLAEEVSVPTTSTPAGEVIAQTPAAGTHVPQGSTVVIDVAEEMPVVTPY